MRVPLAILSFLIVAGSLGLVQAATPNPDACDADSDCFHTGCSSQLCASAEIITTCEFRCEYGCYAAATCRCAGHHCAFKNDAALRDCLKACGGSTAAEMDYTPAVPQQETGSSEEEVVRRLMECEGEAASIPPSEPVPTP